MRWTEMCDQKYDKRISNLQARTQITQNLVNGTNDALRTVSKLFIILLTACAFAFITALATTQEELLRGSVSFDLPFFRANIGLKSFLLSFPWIVVALHFYLLIHLRLALPKVRRFKSTLNNTFQGNKENLQQYLHNAPLAQLVVGSWQRDKFTYSSLHFISLFTLVFLPGVTVLFMELRFFDFHDKWILFSQAMAQTFDVILIVLLWPKIMLSEYDGHSA
uniref:Uncharacterized protein n=1 Tax=Candidatus Kentrum sp. LFY TaxID=2126342 RepID=A0A450UUH5_9GAMM|nr:MAG: hypothetical protein BECKLFY1418B_GA0070995_10815 [Candidatus Kentron sp. LFY]